MIFDNFISGMILCLCVLISMNGMDCKAGVKLKHNDTEIVNLFPRIVQVTFQSKVLNKKKSYCVVLPEGYGKEKNDWPVLFLFHGRGRTERSLVDDEKARNALLKSTFVTVLPDGDDGWYINSPVKPDDQYEDYTAEVIAHADKLYHLNSDRKYRALSGWSMGGYGCTCFAESHADGFSVLAPVIGLLDFPAKGFPAGQSYKIPVNRFGKNPAVWANYNPVYKAGRLKNTSIFIITADKSFDRTMNQHFSGKLKELGIPHDFKMLRGSHSFEVVRQSIPLVIDFVTGEFTGKSGK